VNVVSLAARDRVEIAIFDISSRNNRRRGGSGQFQLTHDSFMINIEGVKNAKNSTQQDPWAILDVFVHGLNYQL
jgi:hypothetical protein